MTPELGMRAATFIALGAARYVACINLLPNFGRSYMSVAHRNVLCLGLGLPQAWVLWHQMQATALEPLALLALALKEVLLGSLMGVALAAPYWAFRSAFTLVDNQRGANAAQVANPSLQADSSMLGELAERALIMLLVQTGLFVMLFEAMAESYALWPISAPAPLSGGQADYLPFVHGLLSFIKDALLYSAPVLLCLLLIELGFALTSTVAQGIPVYESAMPVKSLVALLCIAMYFGALADTALPAIAAWWRSGALALLASLR